MIKRLILTALSWSVVSCAFLKTDGNVVSEAVEIQNPSTGRLEEATPGNSRSMDGTFYIKSFDKSSVCFQTRKQLSAHELDTAGDNYFASSYPDVETFNKKHDANEYGVKSTSVRVVDQGQDSRIVKSKEQVTYKSASGATIATAERPVDKVETSNWSELRMCFPTAQVMTKDAKYLVLKRKLPSLYGGDAIGVLAAWKFR